MSDLIQRPMPAPMEATEMMFKRWTDFKGRSRRSEYWWPQLVVGAFMLVVTGFLAMMAFILQDSVPSTVLIILGAIVGLAFLAAYLFIGIAGLALTVRRFHDVGLSGWCYVGILVVSLLSSLFPLLGLVGIANLVISLLDSKPEPNKWGPSPKYEVAE